jgi:hypothetical protein
MKPTELSTTTTTFKSQKLDNVVHSIEHFSQRERVGVCVRVIHKEIKDTSV